MNNKINIEKLLIPADRALKESGIIEFVKGNPKEIIKEYDGYIAGFGATVITIGIKAALAFYMKDATKLEEDKKLKEDKTNKKPYRSKVVRAFALIYGYNGDNPERNLWNSIKAIDIENQSEINKQKQRLIDASIALKLMIQTYKFNDKKNDRS
jgi:CRISPR/Cas system CMR-associated protein Cmr5 small subunit